MCSGCPATVAESIRIPAPTLASCQQPLQMTLGGDAAGGQHLQQLPLSRVAFSLAVRLNASISILCRLEAFFCARSMVFLASPRTRQKGVKHIRNIPALAETAAGFHIAAVQCPLEVSRNSACLSGVNARNMVKTRSSSSSQEKSIFIVFCSFRHAPISARSIRFIPCAASMARHFS